MRQGDKCTRVPCKGKLYVSADDDGLLKCIICHRTFGLPDKPQVQEEDVEELETEELETEEPEEKVCKVFVKEDTLELLREAGVLQEEVTMEKAEPKAPRGPYRRSKGMKYYREHLEEIRADFNNPEITVPKLLDKWSIPRNVWPSLKTLLTEQPTSSPETPPPPPEAPPEESERYQLKDMTTEQRLEYYENNKDEIIADSEKMSAADLRTRWYMGEKMWIKLRRLWGLPIGISPFPNKMHSTLRSFTQLIDEMLWQFSSIEELRAWWRGYVKGKGWNIKEAVSGERAEETQS